MAEGPVFTARLHRSAMVHGFWVLPLAVGLILLLVRPWDASTPKAFSVLPAASAPSVHEAPAGVSVRILAPQAASRAASR